MANTVTNRGQQLALGDLVGGGIIQAAAKVKLYLNTSTPAKDGTGFNEVANGNGYTTGGIAITDSDWVASLYSGNRRVLIKPSGVDIVFTASGGVIANVSGAYITNSADQVLAWFPRAGGAISLAPGETMTLKDLGINAN